MTGLTAIREALAANDPAALMSYEDVATVLRRSRWTVWRMVRRGELPVIPCRRGHHRIQRADVLAWIEAHKRRGAARPAAKSKKTNDLTTAK